MEQWVTITEHPNYEVSSFGKVRNKKTGRVLSTYSNNGYERVKVGGKLHYICRLMSDAFTPVEEFFEEGPRSNIVRCKYCRHRYEFDICDGEDDNFYCGHGEY